MFVVVHYQSSFRRRMSSITDNIIEQVYICLLPLFDQNYFCQFLLSWSIKVSQQIQNVRVISDQWFLWCLSQSCLNFKRCKISNIVFFIKSFALIIDQSVLDSFSITPCLTPEVFSKLKKTLPNTFNLFLINCLVTSWKETQLWSVEEFKEVIVDFHFDFGSTTANIEILNILSDLTTDTRLAPFLLAVLLKHSLNSLNHHFKISRSGNCSKEQTIVIKQDDTSDVRNNHCKCATNNVPQIDTVAISATTLPTGTGIQCSPTPVSISDVQKQQNKVKQDALLDSLKEVTGLLNKLSESNMAKIFSSIDQIFKKQHPCSKSFSNELLDDFKIEFVNLLYNKAVMEPPFVNLYSQLCLTLTKEFPRLSGVLVRTCQIHLEEYFVADSSLSDKIDELIEKFKRGRYVNDREDTELLEDRVFMEYMLKAKVLDNLRFVGSLILHSVIDPGVASFITKRLVQNFQKPLAVEGLVILWTKILESAGINKYIETIVAKYISEFSCSAVLPLRERDICTEWITWFNKQKQTQERSSFSKDVRTVDLEKSDSSQDDENTDQESSSDIAYYVSVSESDSSVSDYSDSST
ncbi:hypothetical protein GEMRC1_000564 [Eukaryota sp. GEM-RC1]